jgi:hypothetical protein
MPGFYPLMNMTWQFLSFGHADKRRMRVIANTSASATRSRRRFVGVHSTVFIGRKVFNITEERLKMYVNDLEKHSAKTVDSRQKLCKTILNLMSSVEVRGNAHITEAVFMKHSPYAPNCVFMRKFKNPHSRVCLYSHLSARRYPRS